MKFLDMNFCSVKNRILLITFIYIGRIILCVNGSLSNVSDTTTFKESKPYTVKPGSRLDKNGNFIFLI